MMAEDDKRVALEFKQRVGAFVTVLQFCAYGSRSRGDATAGSDLDVFLVVDKIDTALREKISDIAWEVGFANDIVLSTFVVTVDQLEHGPLGASPIVQRIEEEGIRL